jgi:pyruvate kinase
MSLIWGVRAYTFSEHITIDKDFLHSTEFLKNNNQLADGEVVVHVGSTPIESKGQTNMIKLSYV